MAGEIKNVVILGASGTVGQALLSALSESTNPLFSITALTRPSSTSVNVFSSNIRSVQCDYSDLSTLTEIFTGQDAVISTVAPFGVPAQRVAIDAAVKAGVKRFVPSEFGLDTSLPHAIDVAPFVRGKQAVVAHLKEQEKEGLSWTAICSSAFFPWQLELGDGKMGWDLANHRATLFDGGTQPYDASTVSQAARAIVSVLRYPQETMNTHVYVKSFTLTQRRVLDAMERLSGQKFEVAHASAADVQKEGMELIKQGNLQQGYPKITTGVAFGPFGLSDFGDKTDKWMKLLELELEEHNFEEIVKGALGRMGA